MAKSWYSPREIKFSREQVLWLIRNLPALKEGYWPPEASSYIDIPIGKRTASRKAPFETPTEYAAEIEARLERAGIDGLILEAIECWDKSEQSLASYLRLPVDVISRRADTALGYISGWRRKVSYWHFRHHKISDSHAQKSELT